MAIKTWRLTIKNEESFAEDKVWTKRVLLTFNQKATAEFLYNNELQSKLLMVSGANLKQEEIEEVQKLTDRLIEENQLLNGNEEKIIEGRLQTTFGYGRVSTKEQSLERQTAKFVEMGIPEDQIFVDKMTGKNFERPAYQAMKRCFREADLLVLDSLDRIGRDYDGVKKEWTEISREMKVDIQVLDNDMLDTRKFRALGDIGYLIEDYFLNTLSYMAHMEREKMLVRQREGIAISRKNNVVFGRPALNKTKIDHVLELYDQHKYTVQQITEMTGVSKPTLYRRLKERRINAELEK